MVFLMGIVFVLLRVSPFSLGSAWEKNVSKSSGRNATEEALKKPCALKHSRHWGATSKKEKSRGVEMLQNTAVKIGQDLESRTAETRGNT